MGKSAQKNSGHPPQKGYQRLVERLADFISEKKFSSGDKLPSEREMAARFGVSRPSIREAIHSLAERGILESRHGDGTYVLTPDVSLFQSAVLEAVGAKNLTFTNIMEFRRVLETATGELAATRCTDAQLARLKVIVCDQQRRLMLDQEDGDLDAAFHLALAEATNNPVFSDIAARLNELYSEGRASELRDRDWAEWSVTCHLKIIDAIEKKDADACRQAIIDHLDTVNDTHVFGLRGSKP